MRTAFSYQLRALVRDRSMLVWTLMFPLILATVFMAMFQRIDNAELTPMPLGVVTDQAYSDAPGLSDLMTGISAPDAEHRLAIVTEYSSQEAAQAAADKGTIQGYIVVTDRTPDLRLTGEGAAAETSVVLRWAMDSYARTAAMGESIAIDTAKGATSPEDAQARLAPVLQILDKPGHGQELTSEVQVTPSSGSSTARYYFALLAFAAASGMVMAMVSVRSVVAGSSPTGTRRTMAAIPRWRILAGVMAAVWVALTACLTIGFLYMRWVCKVNFGVHWQWSFLAVAVTALLFSAAGAVLGTVPRLSTGIVTALSTILSLFTGLYGRPSQTLADKVETAVPWLAHANPLWQSTRAFYSLLYYDTLSAFATAIGIMLAMTAVLATLATIRMRRMSHAHL